MDYKYEINKLKYYLYQHKLIGNELITKVDDDEFVQAIHENASNIIKQCLNVYSSYPENIDEIIISLSMIALKDYNGSYWDHIQEVFSELYDNYSEQRIERTIREILNQYMEHGIKGRQTSIPIMNAIVPKFFLDRFFEFIFDIYKINFQYSLPEDLKQEFSFIYEGLSDNINDESDDLEFSVTKKTYKLIKTTKDIIKYNYDIEALIELSINIIKIIDKNYWNEKNEYILNSYFCDSFKKWEKLSQNKERLVKTSDEQKESYISRWKPTFKRENNNIYLVTPIHKIKKDYDPKKISISMFNDTELMVKVEDPVIEEVIGGYSVRQNKISLKKPLGKIRYILSDGEIEIYNSRDILYREFILFDNNGNEIKNNTEYFKEVVFCFKYIQDNNVEIFFNSENYQLGSSIPDNKQIYYLDNNVISFCSVMNPGVVGIRNKDAKAILENIQYDIYKKVEYIVVETKLKVSEIGVVINGKRNKLIELKYEEKKNGVYNNYTLNIKEYNLSKYNINFFEISNNRNIENTNFNFIVDKQFEVECFYVEKNIYDISILSDFELYDETNKLTNEFKLETNLRDSIEVYFLYSNAKGKILVNLNIPFYKIDNLSWTELEGYVWYKDISYHSKMELKGINATVIFIVSPSGETLSEVTLCKNKDKYIADISGLTTYFNHYKHIELLIKSDDTKEHKLIVLNKCKYDEEGSYIRFDKQDNTIIIKTKYYGRSKIKLIIADPKGIIYYQDFVKKDGINKIYDLLTFKSYKVQFIEVTNDFFGTPYIIAEKWCKFFSFNDFIGKNFEIDKVVCENYNKFTQQMMCPEILFKDTYVLIRSLLKPGMYEGYIYRVTHNGHSMMNNINPVNVEITSDIQDNKIWMAITTKDGDGLLLDNHNKSTMNTDYCKNALSIYEYQVLLERRKRY